MLCGYARQVHRGALRVFDQRPAEVCRRRQHLRRWLQPGLAQPSVHTGQEGGSRACDLGRLSGGRALSIAAPEAPPDPLAITRIHTKKRPAQAVDRHNSASDVDAARARYLARRKLKAEAQGGKKKQR